VFAVKRYERGSTPVERPRPRQSAHAQGPFSATSLMTYFEGRDSPLSPVERCKSTVRKPSALSVKLANDFENRPVQNPADQKEMEANCESEGLFWKTCAGTAPSLRCIGRLQRSAQIKNGRCWLKHLSMSSSRGRSSKDVLLFATPRRDGKWQPPRKAVPSSNVRVLVDAR
jgi:hypothetical protein